MNKVALFGTVAQNKWRNIVIQKLLERGIHSEQIYNPVVEHWTEEVQKREAEIKKDPEFLLVLVLASPDPSVMNNKFTAAYSLWEAADHLHSDQERTIIYIDKEGFDARTTKGLVKIESEMIEKFPQAKIAYSYNNLVDQIVWRIYR